MSGTKRVAIVGGSGYVGGELVRLLLEHPEVELVQVTSERRAGTYVHATHPHLRGATDAKFVAADELEPCDLLFLALPHGRAAARIAGFAELAPAIVDLSADFRLRDAALYERWYGSPHPAPEWLDRFVYGLPEIGREAIRGASHVSGVGCNATATILALWPLVLADLVAPERGVVCEVKVGSSEGGATATEASHHPVRAGVVRSFAPTGHRHTAEVLQAIAARGLELEVHLSATAVEMVRGVLATAHLFVRPGVEERDLYRAYRSFTHEEPFVRFVKEKRGHYRFPEPKILTGSNWAEVGFELDPESGRVVALAAIDNLMKGAAGTAVQCLNLMQGWPERTGLGFPGLHPI